MSLKDEPSSQDTMLDRVRKFFTMFVHIFFALREYDPALVEAHLQRFKQVEVDREEAKVRAMREASGQEAEDLPARLGGPKPKTRNPELESRIPEPETRNPEPETRNPRPETRNTKHETRTPNRKPEIR